MQAELAAARIREPCLGNSKARRGRPATLYPPPPPSPNTPTHQALEKRFPAISQAMQRAERAAEKEREQGGARGPGAKAKAAAERLEPPRRSGRQTQQVRARACGRSSDG